MERKLTAILSTDVEGYSRLMGEDEEATVRTLNTYREAMRRLIDEHQGRVVDSPGDNLLAEFTSAVNAVQCAVVVQGELRARNSGLPEDRRMNFRIGVNLGDVLVEGERYKHHIAPCHIRIWFQPNLACLAKPIEGVLSYQHPLLCEISH